MVFTVLFTLIQQKCLIKVAISLELFYTCKDLGLLIKSTPFHYSRVFLTTIP